MSGNADNIQTLNIEPYKVLVVVDVQNCFMTEGSFEKHNKFDAPKMVDAITQVKEIENLIDKSDHIVFSKDFHPENHLSLGYQEEDAYVNARNVDDISVFPVHCRNKKHRCKRYETNEEYKNRSTEDRLRGILTQKVNSEGKYKFSHNTGNDNCVNSVPIVTHIDKLIAEMGTENNNKTITEYLNIIKKKVTDNNDTKLTICGPHISYLFAGTKYYEEYKALTGDNHSDYTTGLDVDDTTYSEHAIAGTNVITETNGKNDKLPNIILASKNYVKSDAQNCKKFSLLTKGELCEYESYSAFNYHKKLEYAQLDQKDYNDKRYKGALDKVISKDLSNSLDYSTGLAEHINSITDIGNRPVQITVCGLVGNICVANTVHFGCAMKYKYPGSNLAKASFVYSNKGTRWLESYLMHAKNLKDIEAPYPYDRAPKFESRDNKNINDEEIEPHLMFLYRDLNKTLEAVTIGHPDTKFDSFVYDIKFTPKDRASQSIDQPVVQAVDQAETDSDDSDGSIGMSEMIDTETVDDPLSKPTQGDKSSPIGSPKEGKEDKEGEKDKEQVVEAATNAISKVFGSFFGSSKDEKSKNPSDEQPVAVEETLKNPSDEQPVAVEETLKNPSDEQPVGDDLVITEQPVDTAVANQKDGQEITEDSVGDNLIISDSTEQPPANPAAIKETIEQQVTGSVMHNITTSGENGTEESATISAYINPSHTGGSKESFGIDSNAYFKQKCSKYQRKCELLIAQMKHN